MIWPFNKEKKLLDLTKGMSKERVKSGITLDSYQDLTETNFPDSTGNFFGAISSSSNQSLNIKDSKDTLNLKVRLEDTEYKLENMSRKINNIIDKLEVIEKRLDRADRRGEE